MKVLVIGSGGREHALAKKLLEEAQVIAAPGNPGIGQICKIFPVPTTDSSALVALAKAQAVDLVVVGPEDPLIAGLADQMREAGIATFGPASACARLEGSKAWSKELMVAAGIPTAQAMTFVDADAAKTYTTNRFAQGIPVVIKADGAALGKGVTVAQTVEEALAAIHEAMVDQVFGAAGTTLVIEDRLVGKEFSLLTLCSGTEILSLPVAQDHKRIGDGDTGPNTGGMGTYSPVDWVTPKIVRETEDTVVRPLLNQLKSMGLDYRGVLFSGLMLTEKGPLCLEYNVRFGDPETQTVLNRIGAGFASALLACAKGEAIPPIEVLDNAVATVILASAGYPGSYEKGQEIRIEGELPQGAYLYHSGTADKGGVCVTAGGRVLGITQTADSIAEAIQGAYQAIGQVSFEGMQYRKDIGKQAKG